MAEKTKIAILNDKKDGPSEQIKDIIFDKAINNRFKSLKEYLDNENLAYNPKALQHLCKLTETALRKQVKYYAHLMYHKMQTSGDWGEPGEQQIKIAFCRNILKVDPKTTLSQNDAFDFMAKVEENLAQLQIKAITVTDAQFKLKNYSFNIFGKMFESFRSVEIDRILRFTGSKLFFHGGQYGADQEFIIGEGKMVHKEGYDVIYLQNEIIRTPNNVMSMAAIIGNRNIYIRLEALKTIFAQKWLQMFRYTEDEKAQIKSNPFWNIAEGIKEQVINGYGIKNEEQLIKMEKTFLADMAETILYHELGHGIIQHKMLPLELGAIGESTKLYGENIYTAILEFFADFAPPRDKIVGPIHNIIKMAKTDEIRATRMYFMYLSDVWFYNTEDKYMFTYSDMLALMLMKYIKSNGKIEWDRIDADLQFRETRNGDDTTVFERIFELYCQDTQEMKTLMEHSEFNLGDQKFDYKKIRGILIDEFIKNDGYVHEDTYEFLVPFWTNILGYVKQISDSAGKMQQFIENQQRKILMKMFILSAGRKKAETYNYDHRQYIQDRMLELGVTAKRF
ncbi:MAG: hypothetical protein O3A01_02755 [bacterium]|nr:hypothetical protein [bacterium]